MEPKSTKKFAVGDTVELISGSPKMTIVTTDSVTLGHDSDHVQTAWFAGKKLEHGVFPVDALRRVEE
jgi:uncharacterized protein YodC (DUF2158 family)